MKLIVAIAGGLVLLSGCSQPATVAPTAAATPTEVAVAPAVPAQCTPTSAYALPDGVVLDLALHLRADRITSKDGKNRRTLAFEYLDGTEASVLAALTDAMTRGGFTAKDQKVVDGRTAAVFIKKGLGAVNTAVTTDVGPNPSNPAAKGLLTINMPYAAGLPSPIDDALASP